MDLHGRGYVMDHCVAAFSREIENTRYRAYVTDALKLIAENTAKFAGGSYMAARWYQKYETRDERSGDEIVMNVIQKAGLTWKGGA